MGPFFLGKIQNLPLVHDKMLKYNDKKIIRSIYDKENPGNPCPMLGLYSL